MSKELRTLVRQVAAQMPDDASPLDIAVAVVASTPDEQIRLFYQDAAVEIVRDIVNQSRQRALSNVGGGGSAKLRQRRDWWQNLLAQRAHVGRGEWKALGDCTVEDLQFCVHERGEQIAAIRSQMVHYETLIEQMKAHGAKVLSDLSREQVEAA